MESQETNRSLTVREAAVALGLRSQSIYNLLRDDLLLGRKTESGEWSLDHQSVERYRLRRDFRRVTQGAELHREVINVTASVRAEMQ